jgi:hypothetical protein
MGYIYLIQLYPRHNPDMFKVGFTKNLGQRLRNHRTLAPQLVLKASWKASKEDERRMLERLRQSDLLLGGEVALSTEDHLTALIQESLNRCFSQ